MPDQPTTLLEIEGPAYAVESTSSYILSRSAVSFPYRPLHIVFDGVNCIGRTERLPFSFEFNETKWSFHGRGTCNAVYRSEDRTLALKVPYNQNLQEDADNPTRFIDISREINQNKNDELKTVEIDTFIHEGLEKKMSTTLKASIIPFIECKRAPADDELSNELIRIYMTTKRIAIDACLQGNFVIRKDGNIHCNDPAYAIKVRRDSITSDNIWNKLQNNNKYKNHYKQLFQHYSSSHPKTVNTIKSLMKIEKINDELNKWQMKILYLQKPFYQRSIKTWFSANKRICEYNSKIVDLLDEQYEIKRNTLPKDNNRYIFPESIDTFIDAIKKYNLINDEVGPKPPDYNNNKKRQDNKINDNFLIFANKNSITMFGKQIEYLNDELNQALEQSMDEEHIHLKTK